MPDKPRWTPGPYEAPPSFGGRAFIVATAGKAQITIAEAFSHGGLPAQEQARLFAAADDMYKLLEKLGEYFANQKDTLPPFLFDSRDGRAWPIGVIIHMLLSEARGEGPISDQQYCAPPVKPQDLHRFEAVLGNIYCAKCGGGPAHGIHKHGGPPDVR